MAFREGVTPLKQLSGSGDNVLVNARVTYIRDLDAHKPYQYGLLRDDSMSRDDVRAFVVYDPDLRLKEGGRYILNGTDYEYEPRGEIQVVLNEGAYTRTLYEPDP